jgi:2-polyprenyl-6-methoxyphenol hydroxylase-like FAD-dependent oxidoreductase
MTASIERNTSAPDPLYDVVIAGAGPVGLFLAGELALARCSVIVLERAGDPHSSLKRLPFGIRGLSAPTIEALHRRGLLDKLEVQKRLKNPHSAAATATSARTGRQVGHFAGIPLRETMIDGSQWQNRLANSPEPSLISELEELESVLTRRAQTLGVEIKRGVGVTAFDQTADGVIVVSGSELFRGKWLVGCDGSRSVVRTTGTFDFAGTEPEFTGYSTQVDIADPEKLGEGRTLTSTGMYFRSQPGYLVMLEFDGGAGHLSESLTLERAQATLRRISGTDVTISALIAGTTWTDRARQATTYRSGRVLLAGDAAHIHSPLGGQGLNLGLGDAMNLGWKLAATIHGNAPDGLLDSYSTERHPIGADVLNWSRAQVAIMRPGPAARALNAIMRDLIDTRDGATYVAARIWGIFTRYDLDGDHPLTGHSVPNFEFDDGTTLGDHMHDGRGVLLNLDADASLEELVKRYGDRIVFPPRTVAGRLGIRAALIRPDGIVAWATDGDPDRATLQAALDRWFVT